MHLLHNVVVARRILIVGGGLAGLAAARTLKGENVEVTVLEAQPHIGGKLQTEVVDGFRLDRGFQVYFTAYPYAEKIMPSASLNLCKFERGARVFDKGKFTEFSQDRPFEMAISRAVSTADKIRVLALNESLSSRDADSLWEGDDVSAEAYLLGRGFSESFLDSFFRPFFGGIFLDRSLNVSRKVFLYYWKMLIDGQTAIPAKGIGQIPRLIAHGLGNVEIRTNAKVSELSVSGDKVAGVKLESGESLHADAVILAAEAPVQAALLNESAGAVQTASSTCVYFETPDSITDRPVLHLRQAAQGLVHHVVPVSTVCPEAAPDGRHIVSVTALGIHESPEETMKIELKKWFSNHLVEEWRPVKTYQIHDAQILQRPGFAERRPSLRTAVPGVYRAGEATTYSSIDGAILSGMQAANLVLRSLS